MPALGGGFMSASIVAIVGNPRAESRTHRLARTLSQVLQEALPGSTGSEVDLAPIGSRVLETADPEASTAVDRVLAADVLVIASPTYKGTYSGLLKAFLDRMGHRALEGKAAVPILLGGAPDHSLAIDVHFTPLLLELGASVPARGLFVLEADVEGFSSTARAWVQKHGPMVLGAERATMVPVG
jgi:FMN reductase